MKKTLIIAILASFSLVACKKDRTCSCATTNSANSSTTINSATTYTKSKKSSARVNCLSYSYKESDGSTTTSTCTLK